VLVMHHIFTDNGTVTHPPITRQLNATECCGDTHTSLTRHLLSKSAVNASPSAKLTSGSFPLRIRELPVACPGASRCVSDVDTDCCLHGGETYHFYSTASQSLSYIFV
jgi:hypothetical protein